MPDHDIALGQQLLRVHDRLRARVAALDALVRDHEFLDPLLDRLEQLAAVPPADRSVTAVQRALVSVLDRMDVAPGIGRRRGAACTAAGDPRARAPVGWRTRRGGAASTPHVLEEQT